VTITIKEVNAFTIGVLIALFERVVGLYASLINVNAYHQPGVEAGKKAATEVIALQLKVIQQMKGQSGGVSVEEIARKAGSEDVETIFKICEHLSANPHRGLRKVSGRTPGDSRYAWEG
jgi:glucose-6-phosphate isomerase